MKEMQVRENIEDKFSLIKLADFVFSPQLCPLLERTERKVHHHIAGGTRNRHQLSDGRSAMCISGLKIV